MNEIATIIDPRDYLFFFSIAVLLGVTYVLFRSYKATQEFERKIEHFSTLTNDAFARQLNQVESSSAQYDIKAGSFGPLSKILDAYAVSTTDASGIITYANNKFCIASGFSREELIGKHHKIISAGIHDDDFWKNMWVTISAGKVWHGEIANNNSGGELFWTDTFIFPLSLITESSEGFITLRTDITEIKRQNSSLTAAVEKTGEKLQKAESMLLMSEKMSSLGAIAAGIAHEINNPVAFIGSNISRIGEYFKTLSIAVDLLGGVVKKLDADKLTSHIDWDEIEYILQDGPELVRETQDGIKRIANIAADLKSFSHQGNDEFLLTDLHKCINTALNLARNELKYKVEIVRNFSDSIPQVPCVESKISQVLLNLFVNASHAIQESGKLTITTTMDESDVVIHVCDNGCGMDKETAAKIFEPFFTTKPVGKGTGLGLSLSHDIISRHNGKLTVESEKGVGTEFCIRLPLGKPRLLVSETQPKQQYRIGVHG